MTGAAPLQLPSDHDLDEWCAQLAAIAARDGLTLATAESLTSGSVAARLGKAPEAGSWFKGGVIAYNREVKYSVLHVPVGPVVCEDAARVMAHSTATLLGASLAIAVTGEAGPDTQEDVPAGTVWFCIVDHGIAVAEQRVFVGGPGEVVTATVAHAINLLLRHARSPITPNDTAS